MDVLIMMLEDSEKDEYLEEKRRKRGKILTVSFIIIWLVSFITIFLIVALNGGFQNGAKINRIGSEIIYSDEIFINNKQLSLKEKNKFLSIISENYKYETVFIHKFKQEDTINNVVLNVIFKKKGKEKEIKIYNDFNCVDTNYCPDYILETEYEGEKVYLSIGKDKELTEILEKYTK
ncbi:hypothetical protein EII29_11150 [Leptotrichia sp. OH3620_COT-345]|uniref:hypothetical protein n=1 Tax=Leptotrichia sp. OH3620_COT-345 TaxID=2491048 RepID=UPI000F645A5E|nr:hypothetical protein [Leptotrichia sp. OH3620_COT-345]RRD37493.1 hypothetical protein EII29_11150 [Leptotrichia sp. OH3620_COT-345]